MLTVVSSKPTVKEKGSKKLFHLNIFFKAQHQRNIENYLSKHR